MTPPDSDLLALNTATVRVQWTLPEIIAACARHGIGGIAPWLGAPEPGEPIGGGVMNGSPVSLTVSLLAFAFTYVILISLVDGAGVSKLLAQAIPGARLGHVKLENQGDLDQPLIMRMGIEVSDFAHRRGRELVLPPPFPIRISQVAGLPRRQTPLVLGQPTYAKVRLVLKLPANAKIVSPLSGGEVKNEDRKVWVRDRQEAETKHVALRQQYAEVRENRERLVALGGALVELPLELCVGAPQIGYRVIDRRGHLLIPSGHASPHLIIICGMGPPDRGGALIPDDDRPLPFGLPAAATK